MLSVKYFKTLSFYDCKRHSELLDRTFEHIGLNRYTMITFIKSKATNGKIRNFIRRTWASVRYTENGRLSFVFVIGKPTSTKDFNLVEEESKRFEDILMFDGPDDYRFKNSLLIVNFNSYFCMFCLYYVQLLQYFA